MKSAPRVASARVTTPSLSRSSTFTVKGASTPPPKSASRLVLRTTAELSGSLRYNSRVPPARKKSLLPMAPSFAELLIAAVVPSTLSGFTVVVFATCRTPRLAPTLVV